jgi:hypothetical protein
VLEKPLSGRWISNNWYQSLGQVSVGSMSPSRKPDGSRHDSLESKKPIEGEEGLHGKEDLTPKDKRPEDSKRQVKKEKKSVGEKDAGGGHRRMTL